MIRIAIVGSNKQAYNIAMIFLSFPQMEIKAIVADQVTTPLKRLISTHRIDVIDTIEGLAPDNIDLIINTSDSYEIELLAKEHFSKEPLIISKQIIDLLLPFLREQYFEIDNLRLILNTIRDGLIVIDRKGYIRLINETALSIVEADQTVIGKHVTEIIPHSRLLEVLQARQKEVNKKFTLQNGREIVTTRIPLITKENLLIGAFAIFKDTNEVIRLAEENTDLRKVKMMLEAIINSSEEAISVVDEHGNGLLINPAYTRMTGLSEADVIGKPATVDIAEGESIHLKVLQTKKPVRGAKLRVGPGNKEVFVNVAPLIVDDKLRGSVAVIHDISNIEKLTSELKEARQKIRELEASYTFDDIIGNSDEINLAINQAQVAANTPVTVLLRGASGTGKELFAHAIHNASERKHHKFIRVNCAALAESVLESELFGYEGGAFTGAKEEGKKGLFEVANRGSIFLDEIGELSLATQAKLLRVLQEKEIVRVGGTTPVKIDVRIIAATNANLEKKIKEQTFREDLYYRLNRLPIYIPSLQERMEDLPRLVAFIINKVNQMYGRTVENISATALKRLQQYDWPGNIRELENVISRAVIFMGISDKTIEYHHIDNLERTPRLEEKTLQNERTYNVPLKDALEQYEKEFIEHIYQQNEKNKTLTAKQLEISIRSLYYKLEKYELN
ncbi:MAG TPA: sigma-54-dependent Fis family transcriptional regulator [Pseudogracilibacillus sp.]|nr:sigma-54-dependent Fis family transcriptional regulator [Pseudogracilibacillus sp.]